MTDDPGRGRHKVFLGMAAGVGKTYRMLQEGQVEQERGRDVLLAYLEPHGRAETEAQAEGLERLPPRKVSHPGEVRMLDMDLPAIFRRAPDLCLIDELAHTNAPGLEHPKRWQDVEDVLDAGIDVFSTVNVQHLESLNDRVFELTGVRVRETLPDRILADADQVVLVDLTPEALTQRLREGKIYRSDQVPKALSGFFRVENLSALREVALRQVAEDVEHRRGADAPMQRLGTRSDDDPPTGNGSQAVNERVMALASPTERARRLVRRAWRSAQRLGSDLDVLVVQRPGVRPPPDEREHVEQLRRLCSLLGATLIVEEGDDLAEVAGRVAAERKVTYVFIGQPRSTRGWRRFGESLPERLLRYLPGVDLRIVADRSE